MEGCDIVECWNAVSRKHLYSGSQMPVHGVAALEKLGEFKKIFGSPGCTFLQILTLCSRICV